MEEGEGSPTGGEGTPTGLKDRSAPAAPQVSLSHFLKTGPILFLQSQGTLPDSHISQFLQDPDLRHQAP